MMETPGNGSEPLALALRTIDTGLDTFGNSSPPSSATAAETPNRCRDVRTHRCEVPLEDYDTVMDAIDDVRNSFITVDAVCGVGYISNRAARRIIGMETQSDVHFLSDWDDSLKGNV